jgi:hypothetical protein
MEMTTLMRTTPYAPGAGKFLLNWPTTDFNMTTDGVSFLALVRLSIEDFPYQIEPPENPDHIHHQFLLQQWREIEGMLLERGAHDTGIYSD